MELTIIGFTWVCYFTMHSLLAADFVKTRLQSQLPGLRPFYRLFYNVYALATLIVPIALVAGYHGPDIYAPHGVWAVADRLLQLFAAIGVIWSLTAYDFGEMSGLRREPEVPQQLRQTGPLRVCRHPIYFFALILIWTGAHNAATLLTAILITLYVVIGIQIEEKRLVLAFGDTYKCYQRSTPMLLPLPRKRPS